MIGHLDGEAKARTFSDYLYVQGIENQIEADKENSWSVWIYAEEELARSKELLQRFIAQPTDPKFQSTTRAANALRDQKKSEQAAYEKRVKERQNLFRPITAYGFGPVTFILILMCVIVMFTRYTRGEQSLDILLMSRVDIADAHRLGFWSEIRERLHFFWQLLPEIRAGQVWRLVTPILVHSGPLHIFFNMLWLRDLGSMIEGRQNSFKLAILVLAFAVVSNLAQFIVDGPLFVGMSGVVYGLLGYVWIRGKLDPASGLFLHPTNVTMMLIWFVACLVGLLGHVANTCHAAGLVTGIAWGYLSSLPHRLGKLR
jgi:GlpG protein